MLPRHQPCLRIFWLLRRRRTWRLLLLCVATAWLGACAWQTRQLPPLPAAADTSPSDYRLGPEDVLEIMVWKNADLSRTATVRPDGKIALPLIGDVQVAGHTASELAAAITEQLKVYYKEPPQVSVLVQTVNSYAIYFLGEVRFPGKHVVKNDTTFLHAVALAGGFTDFAATSKIILRRRVNGTQETAMSIRYRDVLAGRQENIMLKPGDIIIVP